ncbi:tetratricopeptide repeat protein [Flammeovirga kamogawensis]|uniref:Tetratricopeptide repeat protein n=1 Tax=Flammeovirga kamogawensis TaxID=373891 RepID=A0ABX8GYL8_9BACT|nr:tetratricopeptide repeat protein [Flammeovirga kamogawensis]MBB6459101.1 tetratricopeptide (TPR) repeat protein [Flammeovirga kamogawensis]QWG08670.1 tetratricopeptide repeat protein [Flammeovirga kamogawensis]TRX66963.1 tetratricopeptide repeat protein [Flammeovirga kamogawensis]
MEEYSQGLELIKSGEYTEAVAYFNAVIANNNKNVGAFYHRSVARYKMKAFDGAIGDINKAIDLNPLNADFFSHRGVVLHMQGNSKRALLDFDKAQKLEPENPFRYSSRAFIKANMKDVDGAIEDYRKAIELDPDDAIAHNNLGIIQEQRGAWDKAQEHYKKSNELVGYEGINTDKQEVTELLDDWKKEKAAQEEKQRQIIQEKAALAQAKAEQHNVKGGYWSIVKSVFTDKSMFSEFIAFIKNGFKLPKQED